MLSALWWGVPMKKKAVPDRVSVPFTPELYRSVTALAKREERRVAPLCARLIRIGLVVSDQKRAKG